MKEHILVIVPTLDRWVTDSIAEFFGRAKDKNYDESYPAKFSTGTLAGVLGYANMRNRAAKAFLDSPCDRLWFIDADVILPADIFELPLVDGDIVTIPYPFVGTMCPAICNYNNINDFSKGMKDIVPGPDGLASVDATGMGCTLIRRRVLVNQGMRYSTAYTTPDGFSADLGLEPDEAPPIFRYRMKPNGQVLLGEDFDFCIRARRLGYSVKIRLKSRCDHLKQVALNEAWATVEKQLAGQRDDTKVYEVA